MTAVSENNVRASNAIKDNLLSCFVHVALVVKFRKKVFVIERNSCVMHGNISYVGTCTVGG